MKTGIILTAALTALFIINLTAQEPEKAVAKPEYVGVNKCRMCHKGEKKGMVYEKWLEQKHAGAYQALVKLDDGSAAKPECLACHTTGFNNGGYVLGAENAADFEGVQCEACHGAGKATMATHGKDLTAAALAGFIAKPTAETCQQCHSEAAPEVCKVGEFKFEEANKLIDHHHRQLEEGK